MSRSLPGIQAISHGDPAAKELQIAMELIHTIVTAMGDEIARRYDLQSTEEGES